MLKFGIQFKLYSKRTLALIAAVAFAFSGCAKRAEVKPELVDMGYLDYENDADTTYVSFEGSVPTPAPVVTPAPVSGNTEKSENTGSAVSGPMKVGETSDRVRSMQESLMKLGYKISKPTGYFGTETEAAVKQFQTQAGLTVDGIAGGHTVDRLMSSNAPKFDSGAAKTSSTPKPETTAKPSEPEKPKEKPKKKTPYAKNYSPESLSYETSGEKVSFDSITLSGGKISSSVFSKASVTMVNIWTKT